MNPQDDVLWPRASAWLGGATLTGTVGAMTVLGAPLNRSITKGRCDLAPDAVRKAMYRLSCYDIESNTDARTIVCHDAGDLPIASLSPGDAFEQIRDSVERSVVDGRPVALLGGDNGVTRAGAHGLGVPLERTGLLTLDAHLDVRHTDGGLHNGNPVRALIEDGLPATNIVQLGISPFANSWEYAEWAKDRGVHVVTMSKVRETGVAQAVTDALDRLDLRTDAIYFDLDVDILDRAFAPACPGARPGGLTPHEAMTAARLAGAHKKVQAMDLVEIDPEKDVNDATCLAAGMFLLGFASGLVRRYSG